MPMQNHLSEVATEGMTALADLHSLSVDTHLGFQKMAEKAEPDFRPIAQQFSALHERQVSSLQKILRDMGGVPDDNGSFMGTVNRAVVTLRSLFDAIDSGVMDQVRSGEQSVLEAFDHAIAAGLPKDHSEALTQMKGELTSLLQETRHLA